MAPGNVVTIPMAVVGDPGNTSVGVIQTFGGPKGSSSTRPRAPGIYKTCADAPQAPPSCLTVGGVDYDYGIGEFEVTVSQYVTFLNTADREGKNLHELYCGLHEPEVWAKYGSISYIADAARASTTPWRSPSGPRSPSTSATSAKARGSPTR